jgi:plasmid stabilization system protein ParE
MKMSFHVSALREFDDAVGWYEREQQGLGLRFADAVNASLRRLQENPRAGAIIQGNLRRRLVRRFPYKVCYRLLPGEIRVLAISHVGRKPGYWRGRK